ncbi:MAG: hypothetical protein CBB68_04450 [Rhodospirillaceae bacterium TMED8]|nr:hypothetical protein [Magnetovibrio sp.]OUT51585.1 MAG: hypothetical protein CBB68_04450 [Rhodospirillaceae bacterium TMED8]|tara:strand:- start:256 stop:546 length:291 start_codon:yes stop_codon:yes gene_type:complete
MKNYIATHSFFSEKLKADCFEAIGSMSEGEIASSMTGERAICQMTWHDGGIGMEMVCWWKAESPDAIIDQLGDMNSFFTTESKELDQTIDFNAMRG